MPGRCALSAHGAGKLIVKTDGQTETEKDTYANSHILTYKAQTWQTKCHQQTIYNTNVVYKYKGPSGYSLGPTLVGRATFVEESKGLSILTGYKSPRE